MPRSRIAALLLALITLVLYLPAWRCDFIVFDDPGYVVENSHVLAGLTFEGVRWAFTTFEATNWHPLTWLSLMLDCELFGPNPAPIHLVNVLFHVLNSVLLFRLILRWSNAPWPALFIAAVFAWHPLHVESVAWISERKDVLSTFFGLLSLLAYTRFARSPEAKKNTSDTVLPKSRDYTLALVWFALGLMAKPMLVTLPFVFVLLDLWPFNRRTPEPRVPLLRLIVEKWPFLLLTLLSCILTIAAQRSEAMVSLDRLPFPDRAANSIVAYATYLAKTAWPTNLAILYPLTDTPGIGQTLVALSVLIAISAAAILLRRQAPFLLVGWLWFLGMLVPVIGLVQVGAQALADRYMYLPMVGLLIAVAFGVEMLARRFLWPKSFATIAAAAVGIGCLGTTFHQLQFWRNSEAVFRRAIAVTGPNEIAELNLGVALEHANRKEEALQQYYRALNLNTNRVQTHNDLANLLADMGRNQDAQRHYLRALELNPNAPLAHQNYGTLLAEMGLFDAAMERYERAATLAPRSAQPHYLMGKARWRQGRHADAVTHFRTALEREPDHIQTLTFLARALASSPENQVRNGTEAVRLAERANAFTGGQQPFVLDTLAMAHAETGDFESAVAAMRTALEIAREAGATELVGGLELRLRLYEARQPYREPVMAFKPAEDNQPADDRPGN